MVEARGGRVDLDRSARAGADRRLRATTPGTWWRWCRIPAGPPSSTWSPRRSTRRPTPIASAGWIARCSWPVSRCSNALGPRADAGAMPEATRARRHPTAPQHPLHHDRPAALRQPGLQRRRQWPARPVVDRLAAEGINYRRAYNQNTVCMPARSTMLTGQYVRTHGVVANGIPLPVDAPSSRPVPRTTRPATGPPCWARHTSSPGFDPQNQFEENARVARGDTGPWRGFERSQQAMHAAAWGDHPIAHYGRWLKEHHPEHLHSFAGLLQAEPGGDTTGTRDQEQPHPTCVVPHRLGGRPDRRLAAARSAPTSRGSAGCPSPTRTTRGTHRPPSCTACPGRTSSSRPGHPGSDDAHPCRARAKAGSLARLLGRPVPQHGGRAGRLRPLAAHRRPDPRDQRQGPRHERAHRRGLRPRAAARWPSGGGSTTPT